MRAAPARLLCALWQAPAESKEAEVLNQLRNVIDPDFGEDIVTCGFIKALDIDGGHVGLTLELTTPACPVKETFEQQTKQFVKVRHPCVWEWTADLVVCASQYSCARSERHGCAFPLSVLSWCQSCTPVPSWFHHKYVNHYYSCHYR